MSRSIRAWWPDRGGNSITTQILRARVTDSAWVWTAAIAIPLMLLAPALWNGYPLLQWDTGGYLARWYEGYLVPSRSTVFGLYLHYGVDSGFWVNLGIQALATLWILQLTLRVFRMARPQQLIVLSIALVLTTALPWLASMLLTDIFAGLSVLSLFILVVHGDKISTIEKCLLFVLTAFAAATHSATLGVLFGLCCAGWIVRPLLGEQIAIAGLAQGSLTIIAGAAMLLAANFALSGQLAWTPGGSGVAFGRMLQDGIVARYVPAQTAPMRAARQQHWDVDFAAINWIHVPVALVSLLLVFAISGRAIWRRQLDDFTLLAATVSLAMLGNAFICGVISGPHDRYGARLVWIATFVVLLAAIRRFFDDDEPCEDSLSF